MFLREHRHALLCYIFQQARATRSRARLQGHPPVTLAQLALATSLYADRGVSEDEVIDATTMERRGPVLREASGP